MNTQYEFHISRAVRDRYQFNDELFAQSGNVIFANMHAVRVFAHQINLTRDLINFPEQAVRPGQIFALGLIDEILHLVVRLYREEVNPDAFRQALAFAQDAVGEEALNSTIRQFAEEFPPSAVYRREQELEDYLQGETEGIPNLEIQLEELLALWLANMNPAFAPHMEFFDDSNLKKQGDYLEVIGALREFFLAQEPFGPLNQPLVNMLRDPAVQVPHSLHGQLEYIRERWGYLLGRYLYRLLGSLDLLREEAKAGFLGPGPSRVYQYGALEPEPERFSPDSEWMPRVVMIAKNTYVWLDQLSREYQRSIHRLDQIPDEELDKLRSWGFTGLWLIGLWERSQASQRIKHLMGKPDAVASAYSLFDYQIAADLGGEEAYQDLRSRAWERGIRLASDMVPNHMGIDSRWMIEHPDWFISLDYPPFPSYSFSGPNLSWDERVGIYLEDHYYQQTDAAVVFKRVDHHSGSEKFVYHGNDGTSMPWNDTAQLNFLDSEAREAVIQTILHVARKFSIIRFDAAMTLAKKHYQRLWFPEPGSGGAIPSRADFGLTRDQLDARMPVEFWREVVDRVAQEVPDTLLLAEAFWLMEGYFVRTLGMHRVYNSAFMNMLRDEENANYRSVMKNTLEFDPRILKRFVNFMNNPDERTAVDQFGDGDKYFGICLLMCTLPGLPMFGHGQVEGFSEKYGMEFRRPQWDESPNQGLIARHEREIFPLLHRRSLFAGVENFLLYDFFTPDGFVNEDVFAYSNQLGDQYSLVLYHNKYAQTSGWVRSSVAFAVKDGKGGRRLEQRSLAAGLGLRNEPDWYTTFRDHLTGLEYIRNNRAVWDEGLFVELGAYKSHAFTDFRQARADADNQYAALTAALNGRGVPSLEEAARELLLGPVHAPLRELINANTLGSLTAAAREGPAADEDELFDDIEARLERLYQAVMDFNHGSGDPQDFAARTQRRLARLIELYPELSARPAEEIESVPLPPETATTWGTAFCWIFVHDLGRPTAPDHSPDVSRSLLDEWRLGRLITDALLGLGLPPGEPDRSVSLTKILTTHQNWHQPADEVPLTAHGLLTRLLRDPDVQQVLGVNRYQGVLWFSQEGLEALLAWLRLLARVVETDPDSDPANEDRERTLILLEIKKAAAEAGYRLEETLALLAPTTHDAGPAQADSNSSS